MRAAAGARARVRPTTATPPHTGCSYRIARVRGLQNIQRNIATRLNPPRREGSNLGQIAAVHGFVSGGASCASARMRSRMLSRKSSRMLSSGCERCYGCCGGDCCGGGECSVANARLLLRRNQARRKEPAMVWWHVAAASACVVLGWLVEELRRPPMLWLLLVPLRSRTAMQRAAHCLWRGMPRERQASAA